MRLKEKQFYQQFGMLQPDRLTNPRLISLAKLNLPLEAVYQFFQDNGAVIGPSLADPILRAVMADGNPRVFLEHITKLQGGEGTPRRTVLNPVLMESEFRRKNRAFRPLRQDKALLINTRNVLVQNFNMLNPLYRYIASYKAGYFRWKNNATTFWDTVKSSHERFGWNQYIEQVMPDRLPKFSQFTQMAGGPMQSTLGVFNTATALNLFDIFQWLGEQRVLSSLNALPVEALPKINFVLRLKTHFVVLNLGKLNAWRKDEAIKGDTGLAPQALQRKFYVLLQGLMEFNAGVLSLSPADKNGERHLEIRDPEDAAAQAPAKVADATSMLDPEDDQAQGLNELEEAAQDDAEELEPTPAGDNRLPDMDLGLDFTAPSVPLEVDTTLELDEDDESPVTGLTPLDAAEDQALDAAQVEDPAKAQTNRLTQGVINRAWEMSELGLLSPPNYKRAIEDANAYLTLPDPFGSGQSIAEAMTYRPEDLELPAEDAFADKDTIVDKSMLKSNLKGITQKYLSTLMKKDILNAVMAVQQQGVSIKNYEIETVEDEMNAYQIHIVTIKPLRGRQSTVRFRVPIVDQDGRFMSNGVLQRMSYQRGDQPIRKVAPSRVALTSYYNKTFVLRSERSANDFDKWLLRTIENRAKNVEDHSITEPRYTNGISSEYQLPRIYTLVAKRFRQFTAGDHTFYFDYGRREKFFKDRGFDLAGITIEANMVPVGVSAGNRLIWVDGNNTFYIDEQDADQTAQGKEILGTLTDILAIDTTGAPIESASMSVSDKILPVGLVLGYQFGLTKLVESLGAEMSRHKRGERLNIGPDDYALVFQDEVRVFSKLDYRATLILAGLNQYHHSLKRFSVWDFDKKDVYYRILEEASLGVRYIREMDTLFQAWVDPITLGLLEQMNEPTEFGPLVVRACELLMDDYAPAEVDPAFMRYRGYERMSGVIYGELTRAVKQFNSRGGSGEQAVELKPHVVWQRIVQDPSVGLVEDSNPIANLREQERMTYRGDGGRSGKSMVERTRVYHVNDQGTISESTVDSGDVGVVAYMTPDPNFTNMRGYTRPLSKDDPKSKLFSSSALLAPCSDKDDPKRINFIAIQQQQGIYADGYDVNPLRTGYEQIMAQRNTSTFASTAEQPGVVVAVTHRMVHVRYADGTEAKLEVGLRHGTASGVTYPHDLVTNLKAGDAFIKGDTLVYNRKYFQPDRLCPGQVVWKAGVMINVALIDCIDTLEDGCAISEEVAKKLTTQISEPRVIQVGFEQAVHDLVKVGDHVDLDSILCTIEDPETADQAIFGEAALDTLKRLQSPAPRAKVVGTVSKIECFYHGDFDDMSENLQGLARASDKERRAKAKALGKKVNTGQVDTSFRIRGKALDPDILAIRIHIDHDVVAGVGDKGVIGNQLKTIVSRTFSGVNRTADGGRDIDAIFGNISVDARMVHSPKLAGQSCILQDVLSKHVAAVYRGDANERAKPKS